LLIGYPRRHLSPIPVHGWKPVSRPFSPALSLRACIRGHWMICGVGGNCLRNPYPPLSNLWRMQCDAWPNSIRSYSGVAYPANL
jgi:hypothetical protein